MASSSPALVRNPISIVGVWLTTAGAIAFITYIVLDVFGLIESPYSGLLGFVAVPAIFVSGLALIPLGIWREARRRARGQQAWTWPMIDLARSRTRQVMVAVALLTLLNLGIITVATVSATHYMETDEFCGQVCHTPMKPEASAHRAFSHAAVPCVACHIAPGASGAVRAKLNGTRQAWQFLTTSYSRPIASPAAHIPGGVVTCVRCHALDQVPREITRDIRTYGDDEANTESVTTLQMLTGAVHWHARADVRVEYIADAARENVSYVRVVEPRGTTEYLSPEVQSRPAGETRTMDCLDCHSRPAHTMSLSAEQAVDRALERGELPRSLPYLRREAVAVLKGDYADERAAADAIRARLSAFYASANAPAADVTGAVAAVDRIYRANVFPEMKVTWGTYKSHLGHVEMSGCFRCHNDSLKSSTGRVVRQDCELCHREK
jgi:hypothetical protein